MYRRDFLKTTAAAAFAGTNAVAAPGDRHLLYVATPGIRNYVDYGGVGLLVFDMDNRFQFVKRIPTWELVQGKDPENVKGVEADAASGRYYISTIKRLAAIDLRTEKMVWDVEPEGGCDRMALSPDGKTLYVPSFEGPHWNVVDASNGQTIKKLVLDSRAHNTVYSHDGKWVYMAGLSSPMLSVADTTKHEVVRQVGPFAAAIRPFTVNYDQSLCFVNVNELLGFEIGDLRTGKKLHRVEVTGGYQMGPVKRHGCPSHGIGLTPDERELWVADGHNSMVHIFDATVMPPKQTVSLNVRDQPGWVTFSIDGRYAFPSTGEVFETKSKRLVAALQDETGRQVGSEKLLEVVRNGDRTVAVGDQFGLGAKS